MSLPPSPALTRAARRHFAVTTALTAVCTAALGPVAVAAAVTVIGAFWLRTWAWLPKHSAHHSPGPAVQITLLRAILVGILAGLAATPGAPATWIGALAWLAFALDGLDGFVARRTKMASGWGARLDIELDGLFVLVLGLALWRIDRAGPWVLAIGLARPLFTAAAAVWPWMGAPMAESPHRRWIAGMAMGTLSSAAFVAADAGWWCVLVATVLVVGSFVEDVLWLRRRAGL